MPYLIKILFEKDNTRATAARAKSPVYVSEDPESSFNGVSAGPFSSELIYLTESSFDKIIMVYLVPDLFIKTTSGEVLYHYHGIYMADIATRGSGAGTVDDPWSITADEDGYIYFTQFKGNFFVQKLGALDHETPYVLYQHDIMDLNRFIKPYDITLDDAGQIFVMDTGAGKVLKFANSGTHAGNQINLGKKGLATTVFEDARSILVKEDIVYIVESGLNRIRRFQYSISDSDLPDDEQGP